MTNTNTKALPTHRIYSVTKNGDKKPTWTEIGAAWRNRDGRGFNLTFKARPLPGSDIVIREPMPRKAQAAQQAAL